MGKLVKCKECGKKISKEAKVCPKCGSQSPHTKKPSTIFGIKKLHFFVGLFLGIYVLSTLASLFTDSDKPKATDIPQKEAPKPKKTTEKAKSDKILADAQREFDLKSVAIPYSPDGYPKLYSKWGAEWIDKANSMLMDAVLVADKNPKCDKPYQMGISESRSRVREELVFYVNCENLEQIIVSENDIQTGASIAATDILNQDNDYFYNNCRNSIKARLSNPGSFNQSILGTEIQKSKMGNVSVLMPFKYKNGFGNELKKTGKCIFDTRGNIETNIL